MNWTVNIISLIILGTFGWFLADFIPRTVSIVFLAIYITWLTLKVIKDTAFKLVQSKSAFSFWELEKIQEETWKQEVRNYASVGIFLLIAILLFITFK